ncbi:MAG TPA: ABC transporter permease [Gemmataceae bacterium]|nr:ABC transporter permease [Gemmataceae bacterium]
MRDYLGAIWNCRFFWLSLVKMDLTSRYRGSVLGICWSLLHPIAMTTILVLVFRYAFNMPDVRTFAPLIFTGFTFWGFFGASLVQGCGCFFQGESYIRQFPAPMAIYPLRNVLGAAFHFVIGLLLAIVFALSVGPDAHDSTRVSQLIALPSLLPTLMLLLLFGWSLSTLFGLLNVRFRDTRHLTEIALQGLFYLTPIMYSKTMFKNRMLGQVLQYNPLVPFLDLLREPILYGRVPSLMTYAMAASVVLLVTVAAAIALKIDERRLIFHL